jgi:hypothetical protein
MASLRAESIVALARSLWQARQVRSSSAFSCAAVVTTSVDAEVGAFGA